ncbi:hypothetical protein AVEN_110647-1 [Araneus ventricosus]|uniref:Uncharacterized protein n=1 Tax=Araneus ventricosus TaxID=182803 RepID=A0A4Y2ATI2_ARAVE|nr:hypothetical protein AVEN_110647-1 [Araneus ventricosus]
MAIQNSNLPPSFVNEVVKIVEDETIARSNLKSVSDVYSWIEECGRTSDTKWNLRSPRPFGTRLVCCIISTNVDTLTPIVLSVPQFQLHKILLVAVSSTLEFRVEGRHHLQSVCLQYVILVD